MRSIPLLCLLALAACNPTNSLSGPLAFVVQNAGAVLVDDGGSNVPDSAHIYIWGGVDGGGEPATVCNEVTPTGPISSAIVTNLVALNLAGSAQGLGTGNYVIGADGGPNSAIVVVSLGANGNQPNAVWYGTSGTVTLSSINSSQLTGSFSMRLSPLGGSADAGTFSGSFAATPCTP